MMHMHGLRRGWKQHLCLARCRVRSKLVYGSFNIVSSTGHLKGHVVLTISLLGL